MEYETMIYEKEKDIATIILNRPDRLNAINMKWMDDFEQVLEKANKDSAVRAVIITGAGRAFCAGADITEWDDNLGRTALNRISKSPLYGNMPVPTLQILNVEKPVIAAVNGPATGLGLAVALACDIRVASDRARFAMSFIDRGVVPDGGSTYFMPRLIGMGKACEMVFTGEILEAEQGKDYGLVDRVVPHEELMPTVKDLAAKMAEKAPTIMKLAKRALYKGANTDIISAIEFEVYSQLACFSTKDFQEATAAFMEKRQPKFTGD